MGRNRHVAGLKELTRGFLKEIFKQRKDQAVIRISDQEALAKIALTENSNMGVAYQAILQITSQERLKHLNRIRRILRW